MDLTKTYPASVGEKMHGIVQLKRTLDKGKALAAGTNGEYHYDCPMDKHLFSFLGLEAQPLLDVIKSGDDAKVSEYVAPFVHTKSATEIDAFNTEWLAHAPEPGSPAEKAFFELRAQIAPDRTDVTSWPDLLDLDEKRSVPQRVAA